MSKRKITEYRKKYLRFKVSEKRRALKNKAIEYKGGKCISCGYNKCPGALTFHHTNPAEKEFGIASDGIYRKFEKIKEELDKCILLCMNCHAELHHKEYLEERDKKLKDLAKEKKVFEQSQKVECLSCKKEMVRYSSTLKNKNKIFCSTDCKKKNDKNRWITDIDILQIKDTLSAKEIAEKYNVSLSAVYARLSKLK